MKAKSSSKARPTKAERRAQNQLLYRNEMAQEKLRVAKETEEALAKARREYEAQHPYQEPTAAQAGRRPLDYTPELADLICACVATTAASLARICEEDGMPEYATILRWRRANPEFEKNYLLAKEDQADLLFDQCIDIADNLNIGERQKFGPMGVEVIRGDMIEHRRLQIHTRQQAASKLKARKYGDRLSLTGPNDGPIQTQDVDSLTDEQLAIIARRGRAALAEPEAGAD